MILSRPLQEVKVRGGKKANDSAQMSHCFFSELLEFCESARFLPFVGVVFNEKNRHNEETSFLSIFPLA